MKHSTLQKVVLTTMALVVSLALKAQAGQPSFSSAKRAFGASQASINPIHQLLFPTSTYMLDDGTMEDSVGFGNGLQNFQSIFFNHFNVIPGQTSISTVSVAWGTPAFPDPTLNGEPVTIGIWSDPNGDGNPSDGVLLGSVAGTIQNAGTDTFVDYTFATPVDVSAYTSFFVGDMTPGNNGPEQFPQGLDETPPSHMQSWVAAMSTGDPVDFNNLGNNDFLETIDAAGLPGNWGIRASAGTSSSIVLQQPTIRQTKNGRFVELQWSPASGGTIDLLRNGNVVSSGTDNGRAQDRIGMHTGTISYQVCVEGGDCSNTVTIRVK